jgi:hypothetical protein
MLCIKEGTFDKVIDMNDLRFSKFGHIPVLFGYQSAISAFKKAIEDIKGKLVFMFFL